MSIKPAASLTRPAKLIFWMFSPNQFRLKVCFAFITNNHLSKPEGLEERTRRAADAADISQKWWSLTESNRRHPACKAGALPAELRPLFCN